VYFLFLKADEFKVGEPYNKLLINLACSSRIAKY